MTAIRRTRSAVAMFAAASLALAGCGGGGSAESADPNRNADAKEINLVIASNAAQGGKNAAEADWIVKYVIPGFTQQMAAEGIKANVTFQPSGVDDEQFKTKLSLDMRSGGGADIIGLDGIWVGEFAQAGYIKSLEETVGPQVTAWDGWTQIPDTVKQLGSFEGKPYGVPYGTDGRVLFYNKDLFAQAGLPAQWQPRSWQEIVDAAEKLKQLPGVDPVQLNAGTAMGEATTMQGVLPLLAGAGAPLNDGGKWQGNSQAVRDVLGFYQNVYGKELGDKQLQQEAKGRDKSFQEFAAGKIGILLESDYLWRAVLEPTAGVTPMANRDQAVGYAKIPAREAGKGIKGQDFVSMSGGAARVVNPNSQFPQQAWKLLQFMNSAEATKAQLGDSMRITQRTDVNDEVLDQDPLLKFISEEVLPITAYRPGLAEYPEVSKALQEATATVLAGTAPDEAAKQYQSAIEGALGGTDKISSN